MRLPRWVHRYWAWQCDYFWLPCSSCGVPTGGHEWKRLNDSTKHFSAIWGWSDDPVRPQPIQRGICGECTSKGVGCRSYAAAGWYHEGCEFAPAPRS